MTMPTLPVDDMVQGLDERLEKIVRGAFTRQDKLRSNKPFAKPEHLDQACANYVWRMLCFDLVGHGKHACMPMTADFDLHRVFYDLPQRERYNRVRTLCKELDNLVTMAEDKLPFEYLKGVARWGRALCGG